MTQALLHTRVRDNVETNLAPDQVIHYLQEHMPSDFTLETEPINADDIAFMLSREHIEISGQVMRWQGTGANIRFMGEVDVPEPMRPPQAFITFFILTVYTLIYIAISSLIMSSFEVIPFDVFVLAVGLWILSSFALTFISLSRFWENDKMDERWQAQQELAALLDELIYPIADIDTDESSETMQLGDILTQQRNTQHMDS